MTRVYWGVGGLCFWSGHYRQCWSGVWLVEAESRDSVFLSPIWGEILELLASECLFLCLQRQLSVPPLKKNLRVLWKQDPNNARASGPRYWSLWPSWAARQSRPPGPGEEGILCCFVSQRLRAPWGPVHTGTPSWGSAVGIPGAYTPLLSPSTPAQAAPFLEFSIIAYRRLCSSKCLDLGGWKGKCSQADLSFFPCHSFLEKKRTLRSGFA